MNRVLDATSEPTVSLDTLSDDPIQQGVTSSSQNHRLRRVETNVLVLEQGNKQLWWGLAFIFILGPMGTYFASGFDLPIIVKIFPCLLFGWGGICVVGGHWFACTCGTRVLFDRESQTWRFRQAFPQEEFKRPLNDILAVQVISYTYGDTAWDRWCSYRLCQLNLVCRSRDGRSIERVKLLANTGRRALPIMATEIAEFLAVPVFRSENKVATIRSKSS